MHLFHKWSRWSLPTTDGTENRAKLQWRACKKCGKAQSYRVKKDGGLSAEQIGKAINSVSGGDKPQP